MLWGFSPATDLLDHVIRLNPESTKESQLNILLAGCSDPRHILKTLAKFYSHNVEVTLHFYVAEVLVDFIARELLLLTLALEPSDRLPLLHKTHLWMELFGNALVRPKSAEYLVKKSPQLVHMVTDPDFLSFRLPCVDLSDLRYAEKDKLEMCFRYWAKNDFNISEHWDSRLRKKFGTRYDSRNGIFEWDYFMKMKDRHANLMVNPNEYNQFRKNGVAFVRLETEYSMSNPTFAMGVHSGGDRLAEFGYFGDMEIGPYYTFATDCEDEDMLAKNQNSYMKRATDIFERNLMRTLHEIEFRTKYVHERPDERNLGQAVLRINELDINPKPRIEAEVSQTKENYTSVNVNHQIHFLNTKSVENLPKKKTFQNFFDAVFVAQSMERLLMRDDHHKAFFGMMKNKSAVLWETRKTFLEISKEGLSAYENNVKTMMEAVGCHPVSSENFDDEYAVLYRMTRETEEAKASGGTAF